MKFLIRADASNEIGTGHVMRSIALGQMLIDEGHIVYFLTQSENESLKNRIKREGFDLICFSEEDTIEDAKYTAKRGKDLKADWVITDGYKFKTEYQKVIKVAGFKLMCIDDVCECHYMSDIVLNQNYDADKIFKYSKEDYTRLFLGTNNVLLRREIINNAKSNSCNDINHKPNNILILKGGSDLYFPIDEILNIFDKNANRPLNIKVISKIEEHVTKLTNSNINYTHSTITNKIQTDFLWCDIAITAGGSTVWELLYYKKKPLVIGIAENQRIIIEELSKSNYVISLGWADNLMTEKLERIINSDFNDLKYLNELQVKLFDISAFE
ncbi:MAG: UDP-2,4-diacetamido-2,4,6-trideoxy-beta-L-altropyranose hydrolase [Ignavibacteriae bacterium]|nr:UDP-2,4-diacetamido-2,4,6-trideoxy-beta-L-altropyranose hydrolase [Ignavibacteriota bacterium]